VNRPAGRIVALDYGRRRIGVAVSDPFQLIATPHTTVRWRMPERTNADSDPEAALSPPQELLTLIADLRPIEILLGIPLKLDGSEGEMAREARRFGTCLERACGLPVVEWDEALTSWEAEQTLTELGVRRGKRRDRGRTDRTAAAILLRNYLASRLLP